jgi:hypothetical protein
MTLTEKIRRNPPTLENRIFKMIDGQTSTYHLSDKTNISHLVILRETDKLRDKGKIVKVKQVCVDRSFYVVYKKSDL